MRVLIIGGAGYIGTRLSNHLSTKGYDVTVIDEFWFGDFLIGGVKKIKKNLWKITKDEIVGFESVIFLAGLSNDPMAMYRPDLNFIENAAAPTFMAFLSKEMGVKRFICASSCSVYGFTDNKILSEESIVKPSYPYGISKLQSECGLMSLQDDNFRPIIFRKGTVGGWSPKMRYDLVVNAMIKSALTTGNIVVNNPDLWRPLIDIRDVISGYELALNADMSISGIYNLSGENHTIGDLGSTINENLKNKGFETHLLVNNVMDMRNYKVSTEKIKKDLNFIPKFNIDDSVGEIISNLDESYEFEKDIYYNINIFKKRKL